MQPNGYISQKETIVLNQKSVYEKFGKSILTFNLGTSFVSRLLRAVLKEKFVHPSSLFLQYVSL